ncbi:MAG: creatininase family protein, partial [Longimicrobiales bacterium]|nr:creatininase family protein [Longimicrobiales bacterium]
MRIANMSWMQVEEWLQRDDRGVLPLGSVEQHAYLSLATDAILAERVAVDAAGPLAVPVFPVLPYGLAGYFSAYPGTVTLRPQTYAALVTDVLDSMYGAGFRRILLVNGHGGNAPAGEVAARWAQGKGDAAVHLHHWWKAPRTRAAVEVVGPDGGHANWMEAFPWTRLAHLTAPTNPKAPARITDADRAHPGRVRGILG